jgi:hypothetical protein
MNHGHFKSFLAAFAVFAAIGSLSQVCRAGETDSCCNGCSDDWSDCRVCRWCDCCCTCCDEACHFRLIDGCTKCAWSRTWNAPYALATPLRQYYIPRPPQCCFYQHGCMPNTGNPGGADWEAPADTDCPNRKTLASTDVSPEASAGFWPAQSERLGKVRNELDVVGPIGAPAASRAPAR